MKVTLEFNTIEDAKIAMSGNIYLQALQELDGFLRNKIKHEDKDELIEVRKYLHELLDGISLYD